MHKTLLPTVLTVQRQYRRVNCISKLLTTRYFYLVAGGGFEPPTFGLCDLTHLSVRVGLYLHPHGVPAIQSLRLPQTSGLGSVLPYRLRDLGSTDFDELSSGTLLHQTPNF